MSLARGDNLSAVLALARAGATSQAWAGFVDVGLNAIADDPEVLTLKGRLLKDQARRAQGAAPSQLFLQAAKAYADAAALRPDSYPLINAATMSLFAGQPDQMALLARQVLDLLDTGTGAGETPYWHDATKAEALLLLGKRDEAEAALRIARDHAPQAWEDHATTLRQFRAIHACRNEEDDWLAAYAPPPSIYFKGMIGIAPDDHQAADAIETLVAKSGARFAYGALAAGADILIAEAVLRAGGDLHVMLPVMPPVFKSQSVEPYGQDWVPRFDALFEQAASVEIVDNSDRLSSAAIAMAAEVAKGRAIDNAARLESRAVPIEVIDGESGHAATDGATILALDRSARQDKPVDLETRQAAIWIATGHDTAPQGPNFTRYGDLAVAVEGQAQSGIEAIKRIHNASPEATIAVHALVADGNAPENTTIVQLERLLQAAAPATVIGTAAAAMMLKAAQPDLWIEPLGELPDPSGALTIYALGISI